MVLSIASSNLLYSAVFIAGIVVIGIYMHTSLSKRKRKRILAFLDDFYADRVSSQDIQFFAMEVSELRISTLENLDKNYAQIVQKLQEILRKRGDIHNVIKSDEGVHINFFARKFQTVEEAKIEIETMLNSELRK